jgi:hypothetical protein
MKAWAVLSLPVRLESERVFAPRRVVARWAGRGTSPSYLHSIGTSPGYFGPGADALAPTLLPARTRALDSARSVTSEAKTYLYVSANSANFVDPSGLGFFEDLVVGAAATVGGVIGGVTGAALGGGPVGGAAGGCLGAASATAAARLATGGDVSLRKEALACVGGGLAGALTKAAAP